MPKTVTLTANPVEAAREAALAAARALQETEAKLVETRASFEDASRHIANQTELRDKLREKISKLIRDGQISEAEELGKSVRAAGEAIETATINAGVYARVVTELEEATFEAEQVAERTHHEFHRRAEEAARPELVALIRGPFRKAWRHFQAGGLISPFDNWLRDLALEAGSLSNENIVEPIDLGYPEHAPRSAMGVVQRHAIRDRIFERRQVEQDAAFRADEAARQAAQVAARDAAIEARASM